MAKSLKYLNFQQLMKPFQEYFHIRRDKSNVCGLGHSGSQPFNYQSIFMHFGQFLYIGCTWCIHTDTFAFRCSKFCPIYHSKPTQSGPQWKLWPFM